jgi:hypothetical protein
MIDILKKLVETTNPRVLGQVINKKDNKHLKEWLLEETSILENVTIKERVAYILLGKPNVICVHGKKKTFNPKINNYGFCNNIKNCECFKKHFIENYKPRDMSVVIEKRKKTWLEKYGVDNVSKSPSIIKKRKETISKRDYSKTYKKLQFHKETIGYEQVIARVSPYVLPLFDRENYHGSNRKNVYPWKCNSCGNEFDSHIDYGTIPKCNICYPKTISKDEQEIANFVKSLGETIKTNDKTILNGLELDIYIPNKKIAIEYNGVYWHSSKKKSPTYHLDKFLACREKGIRLIQIFEDEWRQKSEIVKARLKSILGHNQKIGARNCKLIELSVEDYRNFLEKTHIRGYANAKYKYGLEFNGNLVAVMGFSKSRYTKEGYELIRFSSNVNVVGGASKLLSYFIKKHNPKMIITYADRCWSNGNLYKTLGFTENTDKDRNIGYWYIKDNIRYHRSNFTKSKLVAMGYPKEKTEFEIMNMLGYFKIYDAGNYRFIWQS